MVTWQPPWDKGIPASNYYLIYIQALPKEMNFTASYSSTNGLQTVANLQPGTLYKISVCAYNLAGHGPISEATFSTEPDKGMLWEIFGYMAAGSSCRLGGGAFLLKKVDNDACSLQL